MGEIEENQFRNKITMLSFWTMLFIISIHTYNVDVYGLRERTDLLSRMVVLFEDYVNRLEFDFCNNFMFVISGYLFYVSFTWENYSKNINPDFGLSQFRICFGAVFIIFIIVLLADCL